MQKFRITKNFLSWASLVVALILAVIVEYFSITGLIEIFSGAGVAAGTLSATIGICKLIVIAILEFGWNDLSRIFKISGFIFVFFAVSITTVGTYGVLSDAYSENKNKMLLANSKIELLESKKSSFEEKYAFLSSELISLSPVISDAQKRRDDLSNSVSDASRIQYKNAEGELITTNSSSARRDILNQVSVLNSEIEDMEKRREVLSDNLESLSDSVFYYETLIIESNSNNDVARELGPILYLSNLLKVDPDKVLFAFLVILVFLADPLAIFMLSLFISQRKMLESESHTISDENLEAIKENLSTSLNTVDSYSKELEEKTNRIEELSSKVNEMTVIQDQLLSTLESYKPIIELDKNPEEVLKIVTSKSPRKGKRGRPKGSKDKNPRVRRSPEQIEEQKVIKNQNKSRNSREPKQNIEKKKLTESQYRNMTQHQIDQYIDNSPH